jgi:hypothetical protein
MVCVVSLWLLLRDPKEQVSPHPHPGTETDPVSETVFSLVSFNTGRWPKFKSPMRIIQGRCSESKRLSLLVNIKEYDIQTLQQPGKDTAAQTDETTIMDPQVLPLPYLVNCCELL